MGGMGSSFRPKGLWVILPFACFLGLFLFLFFLKKGGWILHFHSLPIEHPGYKRGSRWLSPTPSQVFPPITARNLVRSSKSHGKWQWLGWTVAGESVGLGTQVPSVRLQLGSSPGGRFCSLAASMSQIVSSKEELLASLIVLPLGFPPP